MIDSSVLNVCMACSKRGKPYVPASLPKRKTSFPPKVKPHRIQLTDDTALDPEFARLIRKARMMRGLSHEELGRKMNERAMLIRKLETGVLKPDEAIAKKLEKYLGITLYKSILDE